VFLGIHRFVVSHQPKLVLFENVFGLLVNKRGNTFAEILSLMCEAGYRVEWFMLDPSWFGIPQTRPRLFIIGYLPSEVAPIRRNNGASQFLFEDMRPHAYFTQWFREHCGASFRTVASGDLAQVEESTRPEIGKAMSKIECPFSEYGMAVDGAYWCFEPEQFTVMESSLRQALGDIVAPSFAARSEIRSGRYYARGKPTALFLRKDSMSHCVGTSLGGAPLFAAPLKHLRKSKEKKAFLEFANWNREEGENHVMRLTPERTVHLFGSIRANELEKAIDSLDCSLVAKYRLVGNLVSPAIAAWLGKRMQETFLRP